MIARLRYLFFRWYYMLSHLLLFYLYRQNPVGNSDKTVVLVCGMELTSAQACDKLRLLCRQLSDSQTPYRVVLLTKIGDKQPDISGVELLQWEYPERARLTGRVGRLLYRRGMCDERSIAEAAKSARAMVDLANHQINSQKPSGFTANLLANITFAASYGIPYYIFPQSVGPIDYPRRFRPILLKMLRTMLVYPEVVLARELDGASLLKALNPAIRAQYCPSLLFADQQAVVDCGPVEKILFIPDNELLKNPTRFQACIQAFSSIKLSLQIFVYDPGDCVLFRENYPDFLSMATLCESPHNVELQFDSDTIYLSSKYHALLLCLRKSIPCIAFNAKKAVRELMAEFQQQDLIIEAPNAIAHVVASLQKIEERTARADKINAKLAIVREHCRSALPKF